MKVLESNHISEVNQQIKIDQVLINKESFYRISNCDAMDPFFMSIVSDSNHWLFIGSNGGLTAGRKNANYSLFPYYTSDKIMESAEVTGSKSIFIIRKKDEVSVWEPLSERFDGKYRVVRNLYKNIYGNKIIFEEINEDLSLTFRYRWSTSDRYGFVRQATLINNGDDDVKIEILDGIQNIMPYGVESDLQNGTSNLVDAYKRNELDTDSGLGIYALSAIIVDRAEPSEALKANVAWSLGFENPRYLVSSLQLKKFRQRRAIHQETDIKAEKGAYFINSECVLNAKSQKEWMIIANVNQNHAAIADLSESIKSERRLADHVKQDIEKGTQKLIALNAASDGLQLTADQYRDTRHFANTLFNIMRGGIFDHNYCVEKWDFEKYIAKANKKVYRSHVSIIDDLPDSFDIDTLKKIAEQSDDNDFKRLCLEYMPLKFSRRHGDPSRPWNKFSINTQSEIDGTKVLDYQGNWRDIFQNWEALAHSYPQFIDSMIHKFLNASTFDGYNPYRVTKDGFDWEAIELHDPWSYIGYWGDHQIIYLLKLLEFSQNHNPGALINYFDQDLFVYANVPYKIKDHKSILTNSKDTIDFDYELDKDIRQKREREGADGALLKTSKGEIHHVNFIEKILASVLAKLSNFIPEAGIWMNTQRPEWNDANNALVGNGVSMVTLYYLRRYLHFFEQIFASAIDVEVNISEELLDLFHRVVTTFTDHQQILAGKVNDLKRKSILDSLGQAASDYRDLIYEHSFSGKKKAISLSELKNFVELSLQYLEHAISANKRTDGLYHAYNLMTVKNNEVSISYLSEMLEGQVAVLSSGYLSSLEALEVLDALKSSTLFREDQYSYILYPNKSLPGFIEKNRISTDQVMQSPLLQQLVADGNNELIEKDVKGHYHFNGNFRNADDVRRTLEGLSKTKYSTLIAADGDIVFQIFEEVFNHKAFTGRSGTFYGYEGLGSIYWHMVSKLLLAVQECCLQAIEVGESREVIGRLLEHYYEINEGIGVHKSPQLYGAFPTDPYSHTPAGRGAQQPGMTGQVKEDILSRFGELGVFVKAGQLHFNPLLLRKEEFIKSPQTFEYVDVNGITQHLYLASNSLCFTYCQIPVVYQLDHVSDLTVVYKNKSTSKLESSALDISISEQIFKRTGEIAQIIVRVRESELK